MLITYRELVGDGKDDSYPCLKECIHMPCPEKTKVLNYLKNAGKISLIKFGYDNDIYTKECIPGSDIMYSSDDNAYSWTGELIYYFDRYDAKLPDSFIEYVLKKYEKGLSIKLCGLYNRKILKAATISVNRYNREMSCHNRVYMRRDGIYVFTHTADFFSEDVMKRAKKATVIMRGYDYEPDEDINESVYLFIHGEITETELTDRLDVAKQYLNKKRLIIKYL